MLSLRRLAIAAAAVSCLALTSCGHGSTSEPAPTPTAPVSPSATTGPVKLSLKPLAAADLGGAWHAAPVPADLPADWATACGHGTGIAALQTSSKQAGMAGPGGLVMASRVAEYKAGSLLNGMGKVNDAFVNCPVSQVGGDQVTVAQMQTPVGQQAVGAVVTRYDSSGVVSDEWAYWIARSGDASVEIYIRGQLPQAGSTDPMVDFATSALKAALAKAAGQDVPRVTLASPVGVY